MAIPSNETSIIGTNKTAKDIQTDIQIKGDKVTGTSNHITGITGAGGDKVTCSFESGSPVTLSTTDYQYLIKLNEKKPITITVTGKIEATRTLDISGVTLGQASEAV